MYKLCRQKTYKVTPFTDSLLWLPLSELQVMQPVHLSYLIESTPAWPTIYFYMFFFPFSLEMF